MFEGYLWKPTIRGSVLSPFGGLYGIHPCVESLFGPLNGLQDSVVLLPPMLSTQLQVGQGSKQRVHTRVEIGQPQTGANRGNRGEF